MDERNAIARLKHGDIGGLETLVLRYQWEAVRVATLITRDRQVAEEIVQEVFVRVYQRIDQFDLDRPFAPWFFRIVANDAVKATQRAHGRGFQIRSVSERGYGRLIDDAPGPAELAELLERAESVRNALGQLPAEQRAAVVMRYFLEMTDSEAADREGRPIGTIKWRLHRARRRLRSLLRSYDPERSTTTTADSQEEVD